MDMNDLLDPWGKIIPKGGSLTPMAHLNPPPENYTAGATVFAAFEVTNKPGLYEVFVAVGRPGEPIGFPFERGSRSPTSIGEMMAGVEIKRYTTSDFEIWSTPVTVLDLPNGWRPDQNQTWGKPNRRLLDGEIWTAKSMDRNPETGEYLLFASYGTSAWSFTATKDPEPNPEPNPNPDSDLDLNANSKPDISTNALTQTLVLI